MSEKKQKNKRKSELRIIFFIILVSAALFIISTYAWFSTQKNVSITNLKGTVEVAEGLEISLDALNWSNEIVLGSEEGQLDIIENAYDGHRNIKPSEMLPVSTLGLVNTTTMTDLKMLRGKLENSKELSEIVAMVETDTDSESATFPGYFAFDIFLKNSSAEEIDDPLQLNYDSSLQIIEAEKSITGLQNTARIAFAKYGGVEDANKDGRIDGTSDVMADDTTILEQTGAAEDGDDVYITDVAIWEPNSNDHAEYIVNNNNNITWSSTDAAKYATNTLSSGKKGFGMTTQIPTYGLVESSIGAEINDVYVWDGNEPMVKKQMTLQTTKTSESDYSISEGVQQLISTSSTDSKTVNFTIAPNCVIRLRVYVWLEGQDVDCINYASHGGGITLNIGLVKKSEIGSHEPKTNNT